jgi:hypothetical protein
MAGADALQPCKGSAPRSFLQCSLTLQTYGTVGLTADCVSCVLQSSVGPQPDSTVLNPGSMTFGTAQRLPKPGRDGVPGPGQAHAPHSKA